MTHTNGSRSLTPIATNPHRCHADGCNVGTAPRMFMCRRHWYMLPKMMRDAVWAVYIPGQERRKDPTAAYIAVTRDAIEYVARKEGRRS